MTMSDPNKNLKQRLKAQIAVAKEIDGDFVYITVGDAKRILKVLEKENLDGKADEGLKREEIGIIPDKTNEERQTNA